MVSLREVDAWYASLRFRLGAMVEAVFLGRRHSALGAS
jgi:hypothetical protein